MTLDWYVSSAGNAAAVRVVFRKAFDLIDHNITIIIIIIIMIIIIIIIIIIKLYSFFPPPFKIWFLDRQPTMHRRMVGYNWVKIKG